MWNEVFPTDVGSQFVPQEHNLYPSILYQHTEEKDGGCISKGKMFYMWKNHSKYQQQIKANGQKC